MIISEYESGMILIYDISSMPATLLDSISTGYSSLQGIKIGPDGYIWGVDYSSDEVFKVNIGVVGISEIKSQAQMNIFPNPASDHFQINFSKEINGNVEIMDNAGRLIERVSITGNSFKYNSSLAKGIYFIKVNSEKYASMIETLIIQ